MSLDLHNSEKITPAQQWKSDLHNSQLDLHNSEKIPQLQKPKELAFKLITNAFFMSFINASLQNHNQSILTYNWRLITRIKIFHLCSLYTNGKQSLIHHETFKSPAVLWTCKQNMNSNYLIWVWLQIKG